MNGPDIVAAALSQPTIPDQFGNVWGYHSRSDRHSKVACWAVAFELLEHTPLLKTHVAAGKVVFGVNHTMHDFKTGRKKKLDLVIATPAGPVPERAQTLDDLVEQWAIPLDPAQEQRLHALPEAHVAPVGSVLVAVEAKACMTAHIKALPRLYDELNSSHLTVHGATTQALAVGFAMVNSSPTFISTDMNKRNLRTHSAVVSTHDQPKWTQRAIDKLREIPRRSGPNQEGFDALGIVVVDMKNDGSSATIVTTPPAPAPGDIFHYDQMINRISHGYAVAFAHI